MPIYNFKCDNCNKIIEVQCKYSDLELSTPICCDTLMERYYGNGSCGLIFKGKGFASTERWGDMSRDRS